MMIRVRIVSAVIVLLFTVVTAGISWAKENQIKIGVLAKRGAERCLEKWSPTAEYLTARIPGKTFVIVPLAFDQIYLSVEKKEVDFVLVNPYFYVELETWYGVHRIATLKNLRFDSAYTRFGGVVFCRADRKDIKEYNDLKGKSFMSVDEHSLGAWIAVRHELKDRGIDPYSDFADVKFAGTHDAVVYAVRDGKADAGAARTDTLERMALEGNIDIKAFHIVEHEHDRSRDFPFLHSTRLYPEWPFAELKHTPDELAEKVAIALLEMSRNSRAARAARCAGWTTPLNYQAVHECLKELKLGPYRDLGKITLADVVRNYWHWILALFVLFLVMAVFTVVILKLNRKIRASHVELQAEIDERERAEEELKKYATALEEARSNLEQRVEERTASLSEINVRLRKEVEERQHAEEALRSVHKRLARRNKAMRILSVKLLRRQERDRQKLAMELHDQLGQMLTIIKMDVEMATKLVLPTNDALEQKMDRVKSALTQAIREVKDVCHRLRPSMLDTMGLAPSLRTLIDEIKDRGNMQCEFYTSNIPTSFSPNVDIAIYRIAQESLTNIVKYAQAQNVFINLIVRDTTVSLSIEDDGIGFDTDKMLRDAAMIGKSLGLLTMKERTTQLKGKFSIDSRSGHGTHILVEIPLRAWRGA